MKQIIKGYDEKSYNYPFAALAPISIGPLSNLWNFMLLRLFKVIQVDFCLSLPAADF